jgi:dTDP-L-rhamnose 4-epimerase
VALRGFSIYGPGQVIQAGTSGVLSILARRGLTGQPLEVDAGTLRDFVHVADAAAAFRLALTRPEAVGGVFNLGSGVATSLVELAERVRAETGGCSSLAVRGDTPPAGYVADLTRARQDLGYSPSISLADGLKEYVAWLANEGANSLEGAPDAAAARG